MMKNKKRREKRTEEVKEEEDLEWMKMKAAVRAGQNISTISRREVAGIVPTQESSTGPTVVLQQPLSPQGMSQSMFRGLCGVYHFWLTCVLFLQSPLRHIHTAGITHYNIPHVASGHLPTSLVGTESVLPSTSSVVPAGGMRANGGPPQSVRFANIEEESSTEDGGYDPYEEEIRHWSSPHLHPPPQSTFNDLPKSPPPPSPPSISNTAHNLDPYIRPKPPPTKSSASAAAIATKGMPRPEDLNSPTATWGMLPPQRVEQENSMWENQSKVPAWQPPWASPVSATMSGFDRHQNQHPSPISQGPQAWESWGLPTKRPSVLPPVHGLAPLSGPAVAPRHPTLDDQLGNPALTTGWGGATGYSAGKNWVGEPQDGGLGSATNPRGWSAAPKEGRSNDWGTSDNHAWRGPKESKSNAWGASNAHDWGSMGGGRREWGSARPASKHKPTQSWDPGMWQTGPVEHSDSETTSEDDSYTDEYDDDRHSGTINSRWGDHGLTAPPLNATRNVLTPQENVQILNSIIRDPRYTGATTAHIQPHLEAHRNRDPNLPDEWLQSPHHDLHPAKSSINHTKKNRRHSGAERSQVSQTQQFALWGTPEKPESESDSRRVRFSPENTWGWDESQSTVSEEAPHNVTTAPRFDHIQLQQHPPLTPGVFSDSNGAALRPCKHALFAGKRHAKDRIYWFFAPDKEPRVVDFLQWVKASSDSLAEYGVSLFPSHINSISDYRLVSYTLFPGDYLPIANIVITTYIK